MGIHGTNGDDYIKNTSGNDFIAGLAGNDTLEFKTSQTGWVQAFGGSGNDTYIVGEGTAVMIADSSGYDKLILPVGTRTHSLLPMIIEGQHYLVLGTALGSGHKDFAIFIKDFSGAGKIEEIVSANGDTIPLVSDYTSAFTYDVEMSWLAEAASTPSTGLNKFKNLLETAQQQFEQVNAQQPNLDALENVSPPEPEPQPELPAISVAAWFNDSIYMQNKAKQAGLTVAAIRDGFEQAGFIGVEGDFLHFINHGQWEDVSPAATFSPEYYYKSKAANVYGVDVSQVTAAQAQSIKDAIHDAGMNAWSHYQLCGTREGIDASAGFDTSAYMEAKLALVQKDIPNFTLDQLYEAFASSGLSAVAHYEAHGKAEGLRAVNVPASVEPTPEPEPTPTPANSFMATLAYDKTTFSDGVEDTFVAKFGTGSSTVLTMDLSNITIHAYQSLWAGGSDILSYTYHPEYGGNAIFINTSETALSGEALAKSVVEDGYSASGWLTMASGGTKVSFMSTEVNASNSLYIKYPNPVLSSYLTYYSTLLGETTVKGAPGEKSTSSIWYNSAGVLIDTIYEFNPKEDRIDVPTTIKSLVKGGTISSIYELLPAASEKVGANQAGLFKCDGDYYLFINDANASADANVDISIKLVGLSDAEAASMTVDIFV